MTIRIFMALWFAFMGASNPVVAEVFNHDGMKRSYVLYQPKNLRAGAPLIIALHGYGSTNGLLRWYSGFDRLADKYGFAIAYPRGSLDRRDIRHWNANLRISQTDDIGFLTKLARFLQKKHSFDPDRVFVTGMSNGGFMAYALACQGSGVFRAIASVSGTMSGADWTDCAPKIPTPVLQIHGQDDFVVPIDGSMTHKGGWGGAADVKSVVEFWRKINRANTKQIKKIPAETTATFYRDGIGGNQVWYYHIRNWGHLWPIRWNNTGTIASEVIWKFFALY